ncbi:kinase-like domain-containing protein, partial [Spinellus fusiger]
MMPLINRLPRRYQVNPSLPPIVGPANSIVFVHKDARMSEVSLRRRAVIKWFGRREAWERECRTLIKLKGEHAVELLEVLTIQDELTASQQQPRHSSSQLSNLPRASISASSITTTTTTTTNNNNRTDPPKEDNEGIHYVTIMEQLDETLSTALRNARNIKSTWSSTTAHYIARDIMHCLAWCHKHDIAFCDLKPSNIMHYQQGPWKLIDFEASRTIGQECVGVITPRYCPPEVARATTYGLEGANGVVAAASVDMWALGCVIYELSTFQPLFPSNIKDETILHFVSHPSPSTPPLYNGLRWNEHKELEIPQFIRHVPDENTRHLLSMLLGRDPSKRGNAFTLLNHPYFKGILSYS